LEKKNCLAPFIKYDGQNVFFMLMVLILELSLPFFAGPAAHYSCSSALPCGYNAILASLANTLGAHLAGQPAERLLFRPLL